MRKFWSWIRDDGGGRVLRLDGPIDEESLWSDGVTPKAFRDDLYAEDGDVTIFIRSPGGNVFAAAEIYTMIRDYPGFVTVKIDSIAASAASVVAMAGDRVLMSPVAMMMCHDPATIAMGNAHAMEKVISTLNEVKESIINAYQAKTGLSRNKIAKLMSDETWFNARKAVELGFADEIMFGEPKAAEKPDEPDGDGGDHESDEEKDDGNGGIHPEAPGMAETLEGLLYSTRRMGEAILNSIGALDAGGEGESPNGAECEGTRDDEAAPGETQPEGEAAPVAEDSADEEAPGAKESGEEPAAEPEDTESGISDEDTWQTVHRMRESGRRRKEHTWDKGPLNGFLYCPDCGSKLYFNHPSRLKTSGTYSCGYYLHYKKCSSHYIRRDELDPAVLARLRADCAFAREHEAEFIQMVERKTRRQGEDAVKQGEKEYGEARARIDEIDQIINQLYEDKVGGRLSPERFARMLAQFETEQEDLRSKCETLRVEITAARTTSDKAKQFIRVVKRFTEMQELTPEIVATLIERVEIGQAQVVDGEKKQEIKIVYNFIGDIRE